jgi:hypothetical protein
MQMADAAYAERLAHAERMRLVKRDRDAYSVHPDREAQRRITARRLAIGLAATVLAAALAAGGFGVGAATAGPGSGGGGQILLR